MDNKIKVLALSPYRLIPLNSGGKIRIFEIARHLSRLNLEVTIIAPFIGRRSDVPKNHNFKMHSAMPALCLIPFLFNERPFPYQFLISFHPGYRFFIRKYLKAFDIYEFEHASFADLIDHIPPEKIIIYNSQNVEYDYVRSECRSGLVKTLVSKRIHNLEKKIILRSAKIFACSEEDKNRFIELYGIEENKVSIIGNGINQDSDIDYFDSEIHPIRIFPGLSQFKKIALFYGSNVEHNRVAVRFIVNRLAPELKDECAFIIKGLCGKEFKRFNRHNVFIDSRVGPVKLDPAISTVALNPVTQGSGTSLKTLDYLGHDWPVISTPFGMRGYSDLKPFVTICPLDEFADAILRGQRLSPEIANVLRKYQWGNIALKAKNIYRSLLEGKSYDQ